MEINDDIDLKYDQKIKEIQEMFGGDNEFESYLMQIVENARAIELVASQLGLKPSDNIDNKE